MDISGRIIEIFNDPNLNHLNQRLIGSSILLLAFFNLYYFYNFTYSKHKTRSENNSGLFFFMLLFLSYALIGFASLFTELSKITLVFSALINVSFIGIVGFFSKGVSRQDRIAAYPSWKIAVVLLPILYIMCYFLAEEYLHRIDLLIRIASLLFFGYFLVYNFIRGKHKFIAFVMFFSILIICLLQIYYPVNLKDLNFDHFNTSILFPAMFLAVVALVLSFNWISELKFKEVTKIYSSKEDDPKVQSFLDGNLKKDELIQYWNELIASDNIEKVIEEMISIIEKHKKDLEFILLIASRNSRNNTDRLKQIISDDDYNLSRNQITAALIEGIKDI